VSEQTINDLANHKQLRCTVPPVGWKCSREAGHGGPCAAYPDDHMDRWEIGFRNIVTALIGPRQQFEIEDIVELVKSRSEETRGPCKVCAAKTEEIRDILRPFGLDLLEPVGGVRWLAAELKRVDQDSLAGIEKARAEERQRVIDLCLAQYVYWREVDAKESDRSDALTNISMGAMGAASNILAGVMELKMHKAGD